MVPNQLIKRYNTVLCIKSTVQRARDHFEKDRSFWAFWAFGGESFGVGLVREESPRGRDRNGRRGEYAAFEEIAAGSAARTMMHFPGIGAWDWFGSLDACQAFCAFDED